MEASSLTDKEYYALNGVLSVERIERILDREEAQISAELAADSIKESLVPFGSEDFLAGILDRVVEIKRRSRSKDTKSDLDGLYAALEDLQQCIFYAMESQKEGLYKALSYLGD